MTTCPTRSCKVEVSPGWSFCGSCGRDLRPNEFRPVIINCGHKYDGARLFCTVCGKAYGSSKAAVHSSLRQGSCLMFFGILVMVAAGWIWFVQHQGGGPGWEYIHPWYNTPFKLPGVATIQGDQYPMGIGACGGLMFFFGMLGNIAIKLRSRVRPRRSHQTRPNTR